MAFLLRAVRLESLDLSGTRLTELPFGFGSGTGLKALQLPATLQVIGDLVLQRTKLTSLDLSHTSVTRIGVEFALGSPLESLLCPAGLQRVGVGFPIGLMSPQLEIAVE